MNAIDLREIAGAKATHRFARLSASKARAVLDLVRDTDVDDARDILRDTDRGAADVIAKVLESAVANAATNHHLDPDALYVAECWADEGPTLKRFRPRARGRATRINKQTCHITVVLAELDEEEIAARSEARQRTAAGGDRAARVAASRRAQADDETIEADIDDDETIEADIDDDEAIEADIDDDEAIEADVDEDVVEAADTADAGVDVGDDEDVVEAAADEVAGPGAADVDDEAPYGEGSRGPLPGGEMPDGFPIKATADSMRYHAPGSRYYEATVAEVWFATTEAAEAAGFSPVAGPGGSDDSTGSDDGTEESN